MGRTSHAASPRLSLKARALEWLAQREQSRIELRRKLLRLARAEEARAAEDRQGSGSLSNSTDGHDAQEVDAFRGRGAPGKHGGSRGGPSEPEPEPELHLNPEPDQVETTAAQRVEDLLDWLEANRYLSPERFIESRVHARASRFGNLRIRQELKEHGLTMLPEAAEALKASELERARAVCVRKFAAPAQSPQEQAQQMRFLIGRGFSPEVVRRVVREPRQADD